MPASCLCIAIKYVDGKPTETLSLTPSNKPQQPPKMSVHVARSADLKQSGPSGGQTDGMIRKSAISSLSPCICATLMTATPHSGSAVHHHGPQDTIVYAVSGHGSLISEGGKKRQDLEPGDFALIPAYAEHQEINDGDEEVVWVVHRSGSEPIVVNLGGWGESLAEKKS